MPWILLPIAPTAPPLPPNTHTRARTSTLQHVNTGGCVDLLQSCPRPSCETQLETVEPLLPTPHLIHNQTTAFQTAPTCAPLPAPLPHSATWSIHPLPTVVSARFICLHVKYRRSACLGAVAGGRWGPNQMRLKSLKESKCSEGGLSPSCLRALAARMDKRRVSTGRGVVATRRGSARRRRPRSVAVAHGGPLKANGGELHGGGGRAVRREGGQVGAWKQQPRGGAWQAPTAGAAGPTPHQGLLPLPAAGCAPLPPQRLSPPPLVPFLSLPFVSPFVLVAPPTCLLNSSTSSRSAASSAGV